MRALGLLDGLVAAQLPRFLFFLSWLFCNKFSFSSLGQGVQKQSWPTFPYCSWFFLFLRLFYLFFSFYIVSLVLNVLYDYAFLICKFGNLVYLELQLKMSEVFFLWHVVRWFGRDVLAGSLVPCWKVIHSTRTGPQFLFRLRVSWVPVYRTQRWLNLEKLTLDHYKFFMWSLLYQFTWLTSLDCDIYLR